jgi:hypothetical protein
MAVCTPPRSGTPGPYKSPCRRDVSPTAHPCANLTRMTRCRVHRPHPRRTRSATLGSRPEGMPLPRLRQGTHGCHAGTASSSPGSKFSLPDAARVRFRTLRQPTDRSRHGLVACDLRRSTPRQNRRETLERMVARKTVCLRRLGGNRAGELQAGRFLASPKLTAAVYSPHPHVVTRSSSACGTPPGRLGCRPIRKSAPVRVTCHSPHTTNSQSTNNPPTNGFC